MHPVDIQRALKSMILLCDTREKPTERAKRRLDCTGLPVERRALPFGDYSAYCILPSGEAFSLETLVSIERKYALDELAMCYTSDRKRFEKEFQRAAKANAKMYLLVENADWEKAYGGKYRSRMKPQAFTASMLAWLARYNCQILMCREETSGKLIHDILYRELKERLEAMPDEETQTDLHP